MTNHVYAPTQETVRQCPSLDELILAQSDGSMTREFPHYDHGVGTNIAFCSTEIFQVPDSEVKPVNPVNAPVPDWVRSVQTDLNVVKPGCRKIFEQIGRPVNPERGEDPNHGRGPSLRYKTDFFNQPVVQQGFSEPMKVNPTAKISHSIQDDRQIIEGKETLRPRHLLPGTYEASIFAVIRAFDPNLRESFIRLLHGSTSGPAHGEACRLPPFFSEGWR
jgi:hypothetical protein